jgi:Secretion system C-terminal sorting domain/SdrD B-like domain/SprB repeat
MLTKFTIMKKILPLILLVASAFTSRAQAIFTLSAPPCHNDGVLSVTFTGTLTPPLTVYWTTQGTTGTTIIHTGVTGLADALTAYSGGPVSVYCVDSFGVTDTPAFYGGAAPFTICPLNILGGICPQLDTLSTGVCGGGTAPFTYQWYNIATTAIVGTSSTVYVPQGFNYGVTVTDAAGCTYGSMVDGMSAYAYEIPAFSDSVHTTIANCTDGTATAYIYGGGTAPFSYLWSTGATTPSIGSLVTDNYFVTVTDANGCKATASNFVPQSITITAPVIATAANCAATDGTIIAFGSGGTPPYTYIWSNGATTQGQSGLAANYYSVNVTDANGCIGSDGGTVGSTTPIVVTYTTTPSLCTAPTGTATLNPSGGTAPYTYTWYTTPPQTAVTASALTYGTYSFDVTDAAGCVRSGSVYIPPIDIITVNFSSTPALCTLSNGSITALPVGGVSPYSYSWSVGGTGATLSSKPSGTYAVTITDHMGCKVTKYPYLPDYSPLGVGTVTTPSSCIFTNDGIDSAIVWGGTPPYSYGWSSGGTTRTISALATGPYWLSVTDATGCTSNWNYSYVPYDTTGTSCYCTITGVVYNDTNNNCTQDPGEPGIPNIQIKITGGTVNAYTYTDAMGNYSYKVPSGSYTVAETINAFYPLASCQLNNIAVTSVAGTGCVNTVNFANVINPIHDMHISTWDYMYNGPVVGHTYTQATIISNEGTVTEDSVLVGYKPDGQLFAPTIVPGEYIDGLPYWYSSPDSFPSCAPGTSKQFLMTYNVPTNIPLGTDVVFKDSVAYKGPISNWLVDYSPWNNVNTFHTTVLGSFDPNFKEVSPKGTGPAGIIAYTDTVLEYMVHCQNTGSYMAENITVIDTLDNNLDWTSLHPIYTSAPCKITMTQSGTKKIAKFTFSNINLPTASYDLVRSNGMFTYTIKLVPGLPTGSQIKNHASIYFDYNTPVVTNTTLNTVGSTSTHGVIVNNVPAVANNSFSIYPNPAERSFNASITCNLAATAELKISDVTGRVLMTKTLALTKGEQTVSTDVSHLASGTYFVSLEGNGKTQTQKLVIIAK